MPPPCLFPCIRTLCMQKQLLASFLHPRAPCTKLPFTLEHPENIMGQQLLGRVQTRLWEIHGGEPIIVN